MATTKAIEIKIALLRLGVKQVDIARALNVSRASVNDVIQGKIKSHRITSYIENTIKSTASNCPAEMFSAGQLCGTKKSLRDKPKNITVKAG